MTVFKLSSLHAGPWFKIKGYFIIAFYPRSSSAYLRSKTILAMNPKDLYFYFGEYRGAKWHHLLGADYRRLVNLVTLSVLAFGISKEHFFKLLESDISSCLDYMNCPHPDDTVIRFKTIKEPEFVQGDLPL